MNIGAILKTKIIMDWVLN